MSGLVEPLKGAYVFLVFLAVVAAAQALSPGPLDLDLRPPYSAETQAAERLSSKQVPVIVGICRKAIRSGNIDQYVRAYADDAGLSTYGRVTLAMNCRIFERGIAEGRPKR